MLEDEWVVDNRYFIRYGEREELKNRSRIPDAIHA